MTLPKLRPSLPFNAASTQPMPPVRCSGILQLTFSSSASTWQCWEDSHTSPCSTTPESTPPSTPQQVPTRAGVGFHWRPKGNKGAQPSVNAHNKNLGVIFGQLGDRLRTLRGPLCRRGKPRHPVDAGCWRGYLGGHPGITPARHPQHSS
jgi:hypothetical protein